MTKETGGPAFPTERNLTQGMTLRDYMAAKAMQGILSDENIAISRPVVVPSIVGSAKILTKTFGIWLLF